MYAFIFNIYTCCNQAINDFLYQLKKIEVEPPFLSLEKPGAEETKVAFLRPLISFLRTIFDHMCF